MFQTLALALAVAAPALKDRPDRATDLAGEWVVESSVYNGRPRPGGKEPQRYVFAADGTWTVYRGERKLNGNRAYRNDAAADPPAITLKYEAELQDGVEALGIYQVDGDTLTLCYGRPGLEARPTAFASPAESRLNLIILKRARPRD
jgi:uncharacterized protein (TIGR03067 family)